MANNDDQENIILIYDSIEHETEDAYLISFEDAVVWIPKSRSTVARIDMKIKIPLWLAIDKEIEMYEE